MASFVNEAQNRISRLSFPKDAYVEFSGTAEAQAQSRKRSSSEIRRCPHLGDDQYQRGSLRVSDFAAAKWVLRGAGLLMAFDMLAWKMKLRDEIRAFRATLTQRGWRNEPSQRCCGVQVCS